MSTLETAWFSGSKGRALLRLESALLLETLEDCFGWQTVQLGDRWSSRELLAGARTRSQLLIAPISSVADVQGRLVQLPIQSDSVDCVVLPHTLEFESDPYGVLREADRILAGEGKLIALCFAPWSLWGLRAAMSRSGFPPGPRQSFTERRLRDWMRLLGYDVLEVRRYLFDSPWTEPNALEGYRRRPGILRLAPAGAMLIKARKRLHALTPLRPALRTRPRTVLGGLQEPSSVSRTNRL
jgi:SAM-dependent methyltransferase